VPSHAQFGERRQAPFRRFPNERAFLQSRPVASKTGKKQ
jgi:hypothetical protein